MNSKPRTMVKITLLSAPIRKGIEWIFDHSLSKLQQRQTFGVERKTEENKAWMKEQQQNKAHHRTHRLESIEFPVKPSIHAHPLQFFYTLNFPNQHEEGADTPNRSGHIQNRIFKREATIFLPSFLKSDQGTKKEMRKNNDKKKGKERANTRRKRVELRCMYVCRYVGLMFGFGNQTLIQVLVLVKVREQNCQEKSLCWPKPRRCKYFLFFCLFLCALLKCSAIALQIPSFFLNCW